MPTQCLSSTAGSTSVWRASWRYALACRHRLAVVRAGWVTGLQVGPVSEHGPMASSHPPPQPDKTCHGVDLLVLARVSASVSWEGAKSHHEHRCGHKAAAVLLVTTCIAHCIPQTMIPQWPPGPRNPHTRLMDCHASHLAPQICGSALNDRHSKCQSWPRRHIQHKHTRHPYMDTCLPWLARRTITHHGPMAMSS